MSIMKTLNVETNTHPYPIHIGRGIINSFSKWLTSYKRVVILIDQNVHDLWHEKIEQALSGCDFTYEIFIIESGEQSKSFERYESLCRDLLKSGIDRHTALMAVGGGVTGDLAGFIAATLLRGLPFIQVPTTLLSQVDSSVGGKTGINVPEGKNLVGAFYPPHQVIIDLDFLTTLPKRELKAGYAEILKYGLIYDKTFLEKLYDGLGEHLLSGDVEALAQAVERSCQIKAEIVMQDEHEKGIRAILNLGHTFGHVFEAFLNYDGHIVHGEAVAIGMRMAVEFSKMDAYILSDLIKHYELCELPAHINQITDMSFDADSYLKSMYKDKKVKHGALTLILLEQLGEAYATNQVNEAELLTFLKKEFS